MVDHEVAEILAEIKRRVNSQQEKSASETSGIAENSARAISTATPAVTNGDANLPVMARAWDRLPPLVSNRTGTPARLELWLKRKLKRASRWFTWEQVNFNAAAYQMFVEMVQQQVEATTQLAKLTTQLAQLNARVEGLSQMAKDLQGATQEQMAEVVNEFRLRDEKLVDEQRVCFRQLSLELSESRVLQDRARRELETRVAMLETRNDSK